MPQERVTTEKLKARELWALALFLGTSVLALRDFAPLPPLSARAAAWLGPPPSQEMLGGALVVYSFSAIILALGRIMNGSPKTGALAHAGYLAGFYLFFHLSGLLRENFWAVFAAGITIFALEGYQIWNLSQGENTPDN